MKLSCFLVFFLLWVVNSFRTSATVPDSLLTERTIRSIYVNYPDSAKSLSARTDQRTSNCGIRERVFRSFRR